MVKLTRSHLLIWFLFFSKKEKKKKRKTTQDRKQQTIKGVVTLEFLEDLNILQEKVCQVLPLFTLATPLLFSRCS